MTPTVSLPGAELYCGDCLEVLPTMPDASIDAVVTDPPYGQTNEAYDKKGGWVTFSLRLWEECYRVAKDDAVLLAFCGSATYHRMACKIETAGWHVRQMWAWVYRDGLITSAYPREGFDRLAPALDPICFATKGKCLLNLEREGESWKINGERSRKSPMSKRMAPIDTVFGDGHWPKSVIADQSVPAFEYFVYPRTASRKGCHTEHPNQKPLPLMEWLVDKLPQGGTVLDPFLGSGTTVLACLETGRLAVGIERDPEYFAIAEKRIRAATELTAQDLFHATTLEAVIPPEPTFSPLNLFEESA